MLATVVQRRISEDFSEKRNKLIKKLKKTELKEATVTVFRHREKTLLSTKNRARTSVLRLKQRKFTISNWKNLKIKFLTKEPASAKDCRISVSGYI